MPRPRLDVMGRLLARIDASGDCWLWTGAKSGGPRGGYGQLVIMGKQHNASKVLWELLYDVQLGADIVLDHLCQNRPCVNPAHLEPVTRVENVRRGVRHGTATFTPNPARLVVTMEDFAVVLSASRKRRDWHPKLEDMMKIAS